MTSTSPLTSRRLIAAALALPLSLTLTGSALASGGSTVQLRGSETSPADPAAARGPAEQAAARSDRPAGRPAAPPAGPRAEEATAPGATAGAVSGRSAAETAGRAQQPSAPQADAQPAASAAAPQPPAAKPAGKPTAGPAGKPAAKPPAPPAAKPAAPTTGKPAAKPAPQAATAPGRDSSSDPAKHGTPTTGPLAGPQPVSKADRNGTGANPGAGSCDHSYCSTRDGSASGNGAGGGKAAGKPCAGCVGKADNKNPRGQSPDGRDANAGYECDRNSGIGRTNPAHTGCTSGTTSPTTPTRPTTPTKPTSPPRGQDSIPGRGAERVTICHATGSTSNPYVMISPSAVAVLKGHTGTHHHGGRDVIPPFSYTDRGVTRTFPGQGDQSVLAAGCVVPSTVGPFPQVELCPDGSVMPQNGPAGCSTAPPVCPADSLLGPVMAGCEGDVPPTQDGGSPIDGTTEQPAEGTPISGVTPGEPATNPLPVGPPTTVPPGGGPATFVPHAGTGPIPLGGGTRLPATGAVPAALPFTGTDAALLAALGLVLLLGGGGVLLTARTERAARG